MSSSQAATGIDRLQRRLNLERRFSATKAKSSCTVQSASPVAQYCEIIAIVFQEFGLFVRAGNYCVLLLISRCVDRFVQLSV